MLNVFNIHNFLFRGAYFIFGYHFRKMDVQVVNVRRNLQTTATITTTITAKTIISELGAECKPGLSEIVAVERTQEAEVVLLAVSYL